MATTSPLSTLYVVVLANRGNPDHGQDPDQPLPGTDPDHERTVATLDQASLVCRTYIEANDLGAGNWAGGEIRRLDGTMVGRVAYNGRVFSPDGKTILEDANGTLVPHSSGAS